MATLKDLRDDLDYSQRGLANLIGVSRVTVNCWENGVKIPTAGNITPIARALETTTSRILEAIGNTQAMDAHRPFHE